MLLLISLLLSIHIFSVHSAVNYEANVALFNDFIDILLEIPHGQRTAGQSLSGFELMGYENCVNFLKQTEEHIARKIIHSENVQGEITEINLDFQAAFMQSESDIYHNKKNANANVVDASDVHFNKAQKTGESSRISIQDSLFPKDAFTRNFYLFAGENKKVEKLATIFHKLRKGPEDVAQLFMLILSFATRVGFTMGEKMLNPTITVGHLDSIVLAYDKIKRAFPIPEKNFQFKNNANFIEEKYRYYHRTSMISQEKHGVTFNFNGSYAKKHNFEKIEYLVKEQFLISRLLNVLKRIEQYNAFNKTIAPTEEKMLVEMTKFWEGKGEYPDHLYIFDKIFALKKFGVNLAERILRQPEMEESFGNERKMLLTDLLEKLKEQKNEAHANMSKIPYFSDRLKFMQENEISLHYEDAIHFDWQNKEAMRPFVFQKMYFLTFIDFDSADLIYGRRLIDDESVCILRLNRNGLEPGD